MAILKQRLAKRQDDGSFIPVHLETSSDLVLRPDGTNMEASVTTILAEVESLSSRPTTPEAHAASHETGGSDPITPAAIGASPVNHTHNGFAATDHMHYAANAGTGTVVLGEDATIAATAVEAVVIGKGAKANSPGIYDSDIAAVAIGSGSISGANCIAIGKGARAGRSASIAIGEDARTDDWGVVIDGENNGQSSVAISGKIGVKYPSGSGSRHGSHSFCIGGTVNGERSIGIGTNTVVNAADSIQIGGSSIGDKYAEPDADPTFTMSNIIVIGKYCNAGASYQAIVGYSSEKTTSEDDRFIVAGGYNDGGTVRGRNIFRVTPTGVFAKGNYNSTGADYAEWFEWTDGNPDKEDRIGLFVTRKGAKIKIASPGDKILGIISGNPSVIGDAYDDEWNQRYLRDVYGRPVYHDVEVAATTIELIDSDDPSKTVEGIVTPAHVERQLKLNPDYDPTQEYIPRSKRSEWAVVGLLGKIVMDDDGTAQIDGYVTIGAGGVATNSDTETRFVVMERIDDHHIRVFADIM